MHNPGGICGPIGPQSAFGHERIRHDRYELRRDLRRGDYAAAAHERAEMNRRRARLRAREEDLNDDIANRYYRNHGWHHYYDVDGE
jgi:hypothetical protein